MLTNAHNVINGVGGNIKVDGKAKSTSGKNWNQKMAQSKFLVKPNYEFLLTNLEDSKSSFFTSKAKLAFIELR